MIKDSISIELVRQALHAIAPGCAAQALAQAHIPAAALADDSARVSASTYAGLWRELAVAIDDEFFNMAPRPLRAGSLAFLWRSAMGQASVADGLGLGLEFLRLMLGGFCASLERQRSVAVISLEEAAQPAPAFTYFTFWMIVHGLTCWLAGRRVPILAVELRGPAPEYCEDYRRFFGTNLRFDQPCTRLIFAADCLDLPVRRTEADLQAVCAELPGNLLVKYRDPGGLARRVRDRLRTTPPAAWPEASQLAVDYGMSVATLRRRLAAEGQSLQQVKASVRKERAVTWLAEEGVSMAQIAERLGFADESSFYRAFRQWFGSNPGHYRSLVLGTGENAHRD
ncbi:AraC family transcriptional regulator [Pseudomonas sp. RIT-PI-S]|uniref:AraC family transcriptional regulator n=1 Tax=Pseudomonas sp. RIT-PI-S TaxID=3035295 RepID=UPI0021D89FAA|nr:AraC family transcriptional regulator [Pseudomonas sp. RIT-PI-S]